MKLDKILMSIALIFLLLMILVLGYLFIRNSFQSSDNILKPSDSVLEEKILNLDKEKAIENPSEEDVLNLIKDLKIQNEQLEIE